jgi:hypothetical protein
MAKQALIRKEVSVFLLLLLIGYISSLLLFFLLEPAPIANILVFISLLLCTLTLIPSILKTVFQLLKRNFFTLVI